MIHATVDANVLVAGVAGEFVPLSPPGLVVRRWRRNDFALIVSEHILTEVTLALAKPYFRTKITHEDAVDAIALIRDVANLVELTGFVTGVAAHRHDDPVLETAVAGRADYLVTGDAELLALGSYEGVVIVSARDFLDLLDQQAKEKAET